MSAQLRKRHDGEPGWSLAFDMDGSALDALRPKERATILVASKAGLCVYGL